MDEELIQKRLQRLTERMSELGYNEYMIDRVKERTSELQQRGVKYVDRFLQKLVNRADDKEAYLDILMEGRFAVILARNNFSDIEIEYTEQGPDLKARWNKKTIYFEVTRRHSEVDEWAEPPEVVSISSDKVENTISKIQEKLSQLQSGEINIIVIWSNTINLLPYDMREAFEYIKQEIKDSSQKYKELSGVLFTEGGGINTSTLKQFYLYKNDKALKPLGTRLTLKLESLHERDPKQVQKEIDELAAAIRKLR